MIFECIRLERFPHIFIEYIATKGDDYGFGAKLIEELKEFGDDQRFC
jgi:hypothetical protein